MATYIKHKTLRIIQWKQQQQARCKVIAKKHSLNCAISYLPGLYLSIHICSTPCSDKVYTEIRSATQHALSLPVSFVFCTCSPSLFLTLSLTQPASRAAASVKCEHNKQQKLVRCNDNNNMRRKPVDKVNVQWNDTYHGEVHCMLLLLLLSLSLINDSARTQRIEMREGRWG